MQHHATQIEGIVVVPTAQRHRLPRRQPKPRNEARPRCPTALLGGPYHPSRAATCGLPTRITKRSQPWRPCNAMQHCQPKPSCRRSSLTGLDTTLSERFPCHPMQHLIQISAHVSSRPSPIPTEAPIPNHTVPAARSSRHPLLRHRKARTTNSSTFLAPPASNPL